MALLSPVQLVGDLIAEALAPEKGLHVLGYGVLPQALLRIYARKPETILVYDGSSSTGVRALRLTVALLGAEHVVVFGLGAVLDDLRQCAEQRVRGLLSGTASLAELVTAIRTVADNGHYTSPSLADALVQALAAGPRATAEALTGRERMVADLVARDYSNNAICLELGLRPGTLKSHLSGIYRKLGVHHRAQVASHLDGSTLTGELRSVDTTSAEARAQAEVASEASHRGRSSVRARHVTRSPL